MRKTIRVLAWSCQDEPPTGLCLRVAVERTELRGCVQGADVLSKWVGEAERQLRMLFAEARRCQPSIIFFDEIDGLAPVRCCSGCTWRFVPSEQNELHHATLR